VIAIRAIATTMEGEDKMKETGYVLRLLSIITIGLLLSGEILAQSGVQNTLNKKNSPTRQSLNRKKNDLRPENAIRVILAAFDKYEVVGRILRMAIKTWTI
jgi:hypothetical protein